MSRYSSEDRELILREMRAATERVNDIERAAAFEAMGDSAPESAPAPWRSRTDILLDPMTRSSAPMNRWRAQAEEWERKCKLERERRHAEEKRIMTERKAQHDANWNRWIDRKIAHALDSFSFNGLQTEVLGAVIAEIRHQLRAEFAEQLAEYGRRGDECVTQLRQEIAAAKAHESGKILDLPSGSWWRKSDAA
jgi:hypothetical protein